MIEDSTANYKKQLEQNLNYQNTDQQNTRLQKHCLMENLKFGWKKEEQKETITNII